MVLDNDIGVQTNISEVEVVVNQVVVNGVPQNQMGIALAITCPNCNRVIYQFPVGVTYAQVSVTRSKSRNELEKIASYCPSCGIKLNYDHDIIDVEVEDIEKNDVVKSDN